MPVDNDCWNWTGYLFLISLSAFIFRYGAGAIVPLH
jgi:hypothetical protein